MMKKPLLFIFSVLPFCLNMAAGSDIEFSNEMTYFHCDFENGIPSTFTTVDKDGQPLHFTMMQFGFQQGDAWIQKKEERIQPVNYYAASTSKYKYAENETPKTSDDWMITPLIWIKEDNAVLSWRGNSICEQTKNASSYRVLVSTTGNTPEDFIEEPVFSIDEEPVNQWTVHQASLARYAGERVYIAFVNNSIDKEVLAIDDLEIKGGKGLCELVVNTGPYVFGEDLVTIEGSITACSDKPITDFIAYCIYEGQTFSKAVSGLSLKKDETYSFHFDETISMQCGDTIHYQVWAEVNGELQDKINCRTISFLFCSQRKTVIEEVTGMWCVYCPTGIVAMNLLDEKYPDQFIGLALHYNDPLEVRKYVRDLDFPCFPSGWVNRKYLIENPMVLTEKNGIKMYTTLKGGFETYFLKAQQEQAIADLSVTAEIIGNQIKVKAVSRFAIDIPVANYQIAFAVIEDGVTDPSYSQSNAFSGGDAKIGGYELLPPKIESPIFEHVARGIYDDFRGIPGSIPNAIEAGISYSFEYVIDVPESIKSLQNLKVIAMLIDHNTGEIANANIIGSLPSGISGISLDLPSLSCSQEGTDCLVNFISGSTSPVIISFYNTNGVLVLQKGITAEGDHFSCRIPINYIHGLHIITAEQNSDMTACKVFF